MANRHRGEIEAELDGKRYRLCLTLGALAELESTFGDEDMLALAERFSLGRLAARDAIRVLGAGLRGAGNDISDDLVARMRVDNGAAGFVAVVAELLNATFADAAPAGDALVEAEPAQASRTGTRAAEPEPASQGASETRPFPGRTP